MSARHAGGSPPDVTHRPGSPSWARLALAAGVLQVRILRHSLFDLFTLLITPIQTIGFVAIFRHAGRPDLDLYGVLAPGIIALWQLALLISGEVIARDRDNQRLEPLCAAPGSLTAVLVGRVSVITGISLVGLGLSFLAGWLVFDVRLHLGAPAVFAVALLCTVATTVATAVLFSVIFVNSRSPRIFQNSASYPFYVLGGVIVPIALYPDWVQPLSRLVFLSWSSDLLRDAVHSTNVAGWVWRCGVVLALGVLTALLARWALARTLRNARREGRLGLAG